MTHRFKDPYVHPITFLYRVMRDPTAAIEDRVHAAIALLEIEYQTADPIPRRRRSKRLVEPPSCTVRIPDLAELPIKGYA
jgi:hypothetical protein